MSSFWKNMSFSTKFINKENEVYILYFKYHRGICTIHARKRLKTLNIVLLIYFKFIVIGWAMVHILKQTIRSTRVFTLSYAILIIFIPVPFQRGNE